MIHFYDALQTIPILNACILNFYLKLKDEINNPPGNIFIFLCIFGSERAQGVTMSVRPPVRPVQVCLEQEIFMFLGQIQIAIREQSEHSETETIKEQVGP